MAIGDISLEEGLMETSRGLPPSTFPSVTNPVANDLGPDSTVTLADEQGTIPAFPPAAIDPTTGRILPISPEELAARRDAAIRTVKAIRQVTDASDTEENWREIFRGIDEARPQPRRSS
jgi:hypothetical protein